ncbi:MAG TPA: bacillithiol transferase BstA [Blastocatellia bacterium]|nr:bacillithiol transferase BstA [Blastocatellia bacterium]
MDLRYPIGQFRLEGNPTETQIQTAIDEIAEAPAKLRAAVEGLSAEQLETPYRPEGWTVRQVVHHVPDSHLNSYIRLRLALTEDTPTIKPYDENRWAQLEDSRSAPIDVSLALLGSLHERWVILLRSLGAADFARHFKHPDIGVVSVGKNTCLYAWHGKHHVAHITFLRERMGWN